jgi:glycolate oxidase iron-sulfur subunit
MDLTDFTECNKCGKCKETCISYRIFLNEAFSPRGRVQIFRYFKDGNIPENKTLRERIFSCLLCGACTANCPLQVNVPLLIYDAREKMKKNLFQLLFRYFSFYPKLFFSISSMLSSFKPLKHFITKQKLLPITFLNKLSNYEKKSFDACYLKVFNKIRPKGRIALFLGCSTNFLMPSISNAIIETLLSANFEVIVPKQNCCGAPLLGAGFKREMITLAKKNLFIYKSFHIDGVITPCPTCGHFLNSVYQELINENINILNIADLIENIELSSTNIEEKKIFFHISCHFSNYLKESSKIINLFNKVGVNIERKEGCCGFAGLFSFLFPKASMDIMKQKILEYQKADMIISSCPNCIIHFKNSMQNKKILHYTEFIWEKLLKGVKNDKRNF